MSNNPDASHIDSVLDAGLERAAEARTLLVACDYDGVLAPIVDDPGSAFPLPGAIEALAELAGLPNTWVSLVSGRSLEALMSLANPPRAVGLVGSHGAERIDPTGPAGPGGAHHVEDLVRSSHDEANELLAELVTEVRAAVSRVPGSRLETKPVGVAFHYRQADPAAGTSAADALIERLAARPGVHVRTGKMVAEFAVAGSDKGEALESLVVLTQPDVTLFIGDDVTDEDGFAVLGADDVGIKVGDGETAAAYRVASPDAALDALVRLARRRTGRS